MTPMAFVESYTINLVSQLTGVSYPDGTSTTYSYDPAGNRLTETTAGTTISYVYDDASRLASIDGVGNSYDGAGNLLFDGAITYGWDWQSRLNTADDGTTVTSFSYDGDNIRVAVDSVDHLYDRQGWTGLPELVSTGTTAFTHSPEGVINQIGATTTGLLADGLGSVRHLTDPAGASIGSSGFDVFGEITTQTGTASPFGFTGAQQFDDLVYLNARYLTPDVGRFLSVDPVRPGAPGVTGYNPYTYVNNNPTTWVDPSGAVALTAEALLRILILTAVVRDWGLRCVQDR